MGIDVVSIGISGMDAAQRRLSNSAHNVANSLTKDFRNHRTRQVEQAGGGTRALTLVDAEPRPVKLAAEFVEQKLAEVQSKASARTVRTALDLQGSLIDILA